MESLDINSDGTLIKKAVIMGNVPKTKAKVAKIIAEAAYSNSVLDSFNDHANQSNIEDRSETLKSLIENYPEMPVELWEEAFEELNDCGFFRKNSNYDSFYICDYLDNDSSGRWIDDYDWDCITEVINPVEDCGLIMDSEGNWMYEDDIDPEDREC